SSSTLTRLPGGALTLVPFSGVANLGNPSGSATDFEQWKVNGGVAVKITNLGTGDTPSTIGPTDIVSWVDGGNSAGEFVTYDTALGFKAAGYSTLTDINDPNVNNTTVFKVGTTAATLTGNRTVLALNTSASITGA